MSAAALERLPSRRIQVGAQYVDVRVRSSPNATMIRLRVGPEHPLEVIVPAGTVDRRIDEVLRQRADWIARKLNASRTVSERAPALGLARPAVVWLNAEPIPVEFTGAGRSQARLIDGVVRAGGVPAGAAGALTRWYRREARSRLRTLVAREAARLGVDYRLIAVRDQRTRWGSCSAATNLAFNWRLVMAPEEVQRYVIVHELCHVRVRNHSKEFWRLLDTTMPGWRDQAAWLREHGHELRGYAAEVACSPAGMANVP